MLKKVEKLIITFHTTTEAMNMEECCKKEEAPGRLIPVPVSITAGCGLAWCASLRDREILEALMEEKEIHPQGVFQCLV